MQLTLQQISLPLLFALVSTTCLDFGFCILQSIVVSLKEGMFNNANDLQNLPYEIRQWCFQSDTRLHPSRASEQAADCMSS